MTSLSSSASCTFQLVFVRAELDAQRFIKVNISKSLKEHFSKTNDCCFDIFQSATTWWQYIVVKETGKCFWIPWLVAFFFCNQSMISVYHQKKEEESSLLFFTAVNTTYLTPLRVIWKYVSVFAVIRWTDPLITLPLFPFFQVSQHIPLTALTVGSVYQPRLNSEVT